MIRMTLLIVPQIADFYNTRIKVVLGLVLSLYISFSYIEKSGGMTTTGEKKIIAEVHHLFPVDIRNVVIQDEFWSPKLKIWRHVTVHDNFDKFEKSGAFDNFDHARDHLMNKHTGVPFHDGLVYEMIRGAADYLIAEPDSRLVSRIDSYIERIAAAQQPDGYLNTYTFLLEPDHRWGLNGGNDYYKHDTYNAGCLIDAGIHYYKATGKIRLLAVAVKQANLMADLMGPPPKKNILTGHSLGEEALVRLYELFQEQPDLGNIIGVPCDPHAWLKLAEFWIETRGHYDGRENLGSVCQDHEPVFQQQTLEGHAVRATLMGAGIAALAKINGRPEYVESAMLLWENLVQRRMQITGGVGSYPILERIAPDYVLPNNAYLETCAAIGACFFHHNMNCLLADAGYANELERALYNGVICGTSLGGTSYLYTNPLEAGILRQRWPWHDCPCCPPMFAKMMGALPGYIYATDQDGLYVNLFVGSKAHAVVNGNQWCIEQKTAYPWAGKIQLTLTSDRPAQFTLRMRIPEWCQKGPAHDELYASVGRPASHAFTLSVNGQHIASDVQRGYVSLTRTWRSGDRVELNLQLEPRLIQSHPNVLNNTGKHALSYGPLIYCLESTDNNGGVFCIELPVNASLQAIYKPDMLGGVTILEADGTRIDADTGLRHSARIRAIPYYANANRGPVEMLVWVPEKLDHVVTSSRCDERDSVLVLYDPIEPKKSSDMDVSHLSWWDHSGTQEWVQYTFSEPRTFSSSEVYWTDDSPQGGRQRIPAEWRILYRKEGQWVPVENTSSYQLSADQYNRVTFKPVTTTALCLQVQLQHDFSGGLYKWRNR